MTTNISVEINDLIYDLENLNTLFILESPHSDEFLNKYPTSGHTGRVISKKLLNRSDIPVSLLVKHSELSNILELPNLTHIGFMNVSNKPLQSKAYTDNGISPPDDIKDLSYIRNDLQKSLRTQRKRYKKDITECVHSLLINDFTQRLFSILNNASGLSKIVPCGYFANYFVNKAMSDRSYNQVNIINNTPHPSTGWNDLIDEATSQLIELIYQQQT